MLTYEYIKSEFLYKWFKNQNYVTVTGPYTEELASLSNRLVDIVENDTGCVTSESSTCLYGGDSIKNYVQYPTNEDKTKNIWRILGSYIIDGETVTKMIKVDTVNNLDDFQLLFFHHNKQVKF
jgi:hypothetical protein